jgi:hypothetical protein
MISAMTNTSNTIVYTERRELAEVSRSLRRLKRKIFLQHVAEAEKPRDVLRDMILRMSLEAENSQSFQFSQSSLDVHSIDEEDDSSSSEEV